MTDNFSEAGYLSANPDVAQAVAQGSFQSGRQHYDLFGKSEGRDPGIARNVAETKLADARSGSWVWFTQPSAVRVKDGILASSVRRALPRGGATVLTRYSDGRPGEPAVVGRSARLDDHDQAAFIVRKSDGRVLAFFNHHTLNQYYLVPSRNDDPRSAQDWEAPVDIAPQLGGSTYTYAQPVQMDDGTIYLFLRMQTGDIHSLHFTRSSDGGESWSSATCILTGSRPYFSVAKNGPSRIDIACNDGHPNEVEANSLYHFYMRAERGEEHFHASDGKSLTLPITPAAHLPQVWDGSTPAGSSWIWHIGVDRNGAPALVYAVFPDRDTDHRYRRAVWNGGGWDDTEICAAGPSFAGRSSGEHYYTGGCSFDPDDINVVYCSRLVAGVRQIFHMEAGADGWSSRQLTYSVHDCVRPYVAKGSRTLFYVEVTAYPHYLDYDADLVSVDLDWLA